MKLFLMELKDFGIHFPLCVVCFLVSASSACRGVIAPASLWTVWRVTLGQSETEMMSGNKRHDQALITLFPNSSSGPQSGLLDEGHSSPAMTVTVQSPARQSGCLNSVNSNTGIMGCSSAGTWSVRAGMLGAVLTGLHLAMDEGPPRLSCCHSQRRPTCQGNPKRGGLGEGHHGSRRLR